MPKPRTVVITCSVLELEIEHFSEGLAHVVAIERLPQGLHNDPPKLRRDLQTAVDDVERRFAPEAIVLGYGLCSRGTEEVRASRARLVVPRAHDCITLLLGSKERYADYVREAPGTYWYSPGWNKHHVPPGRKRYVTLLRQYRSQYGADNAKYLMVMEQGWFGSYDRATYVHLGVGDLDEDTRYTKECADWLKWGFDSQAGEPALLRDLLDCNWDEERYLVLEPGQSLRLTADDRVIEVAPDAP